MKRLIRTACLALLIVFGMLLALMFGRYPTRGIPADTVKIEVRRTGDGPAVLTLAHEKEIQEAQDIVGWVWNGIGSNSLEYAERYHLTLIQADGISMSLWITPSEWGDHARTPKGFIDFLKRKQTEQEASLPKHATPTG